MALEESRAAAEADNTAESRIGVEPSAQPNNTEAGPSDAWCAELQSGAPAGPVYVPNALNNRGPRQGNPLCA